MAVVGDLCCNQLWQWLETYNVTSYGSGWRKEGGRTAMLGVLKRRQFRTHVRSVIDELVAGTGTTNSVDVEIAYHVHFSRDALNEEQTHNS